MTVGDHQNAQRGGGRSLSGGVMLLIGLLAGVALAAAAGIFILGIGWATPLDAQSVISASPTPSPSPSASADTTTTEPGGVSEACVRAAEYNVVVDEAVDDLARGAEAQDARALQETLDRLQDARETADGASEQCLAQAGRTPPADPSASPEPSLSRSPSADPSVDSSLSPSDSADPSVVSSANPSPSPSPTS